MLWTVVLEKTLESLLECKEIQPVHCKGDQSWEFIGKINSEAETPILWPPDVKDWLIWKDPDAGKDWRWEEKGITKDEMVEWHHWLNGNKFEYTRGVDDGQGSLACCSPWGHKELDTTEWQNRWSICYSCQRSWELFFFSLYPTRSLKLILSKEMTLLVVFIINFYLVAKFHWMLLGKGRWLRILERGH